MTSCIYSSQCGFFPQKVLLAEFFHETFCVCSLVGRGATQAVLQIHIKGIVLGRYMVAFLSLEIHGKKKLGPDFIYWIMHKIS